MAELFGLGVKLGAQRTDLRFGETIDTHRRKYVLHLACADAAHERLLDHGDQRALAAPKLLDNRGPEVAVACSRNLQIDRAGPCVESTRSRAVAQVAARLGSFMGCRTHVIVKLRLNGRIVDEAEHLPQHVDVFGAEQLGERRPLLECQIRKRHWIL